MISEERFPILDSTAWRAARRYNTDPLDIEDCYDYILEHVALKISDSDNAAYIRMKCQSAAHNWYESEQRHVARANYELEVEDLRKNEELPPEDQVIEREDLALIRDLFKFVNLTCLEQNILETRMGGFVTLRDIAELEGITHWQARSASMKTRSKIVPAVAELAGEYGYDTAKQANTRKGHSTPSGDRCEDYYFPRRKEANP